MPSLTVTMSIEEFDAFVAKKVVEELERRQALPVSSGGLGNVSIGEGMASTVSIKEAIQLMPVGLRSDASLRRAIKTRRIPAKKIGSRWCLVPKDVIAALSREAGSKAQTEQFAAHWEAKRKEIEAKRKWPIRIRKRRV